MSPGEPRKQPGLVEVNLTPGEIAETASKLAPLDHALLGM